MTTKTESYSVSNPIASLITWYPQQAEMSDHAISNCRTRREQARTTVSSNESHSRNPFVFHPPHFCRSYNLNNEIGRSIQRTVEHCKDKHQSTSVFFGHSPWILWGHSASLTLAVAEGATLPSNDYCVSIDMADFRTELKSDVIFMCPQMDHEPKDFELVTSGRCWLGTGWRPLDGSSKPNKMRSALKNNYLDKIIRRLLGIGQSPSISDARLLDLELLSFLPRGRQTTIIPPFSDEKDVDGTLGFFGFVSQTEHWTTISVLAPMKGDSPRRCDIDAARDIVLTIIGKGEDLTGEPEQEEDEQEETKGSGG